MSQEEIIKYMDEMIESNSNPYANQFYVSMDIYTQLNISEYKGNLIYLLSNMKEDTMILSDYNPLLPQ